MKVTPWLPPESMEDELIALVVEAELAGLQELEPELAKGYDEGLSATAKMTAVIAAVLTARRIRRVWTSAGERSSRASLSHWLREARRAGITDRLVSPDLPSQVLDRWRLENEERYELLRDKVRRETAIQIRLSRSLGLAPQTVADDFARHGLPSYNGRMRGRALVISSDQIHTLSGLLAQHQQNDAGIRSFIWRTQGDSRVRPDHRRLRNRIFRWDRPPSIGFPGEPVACRCWAQGIVGPATISAP